MPFAEKLLITLIEKKKHSHKLQKLNYFPFLITSDWNTEKKYSEESIN